MWMVAFGQKLNGSGILERYNDLYASLTFQFLCSVKELYKHF